MDASLPTYGADEAGLICGFLLHPNGPVEAILSAQAAAWLAAQDDAAGFLWLHFNLAHTAAQPWLAQHANLSDTFFETLRDGLHSTRIERADDALIAVVNDVHFDFSFEPSDISTLWVHVDRRLVVTARERPLRSVDRLRLAVKHGEALRSSVALLETLLRAQADTLVGIVREMAERIDDIEDKLLAGRLDHKRAKLGKLRRVLVRLHRVNLFSQD